MRGIEKKNNFIPEGLTPKQASELKAARPYYALTPDERKAVKKRPSFTAYKLASVRAELERLFGGKCAYCESNYSTTAPVDIEHFRPKGQVQDVKHDGYWWLAASWDNLLPSCIDCNRKRKQPTPKPGTNLVAMLVDGTGTLLTNTGKKDSFPLADETRRATGEQDDLNAEAPLLLNPCTDKPEDHLDFSYHPAIGAAIVYPKSTPPAIINPVGADATPASAAAAAETAAVRAAVSIHIYGLNRLGLVQARTRVVRRLEFLASLFVDLEALCADVETSSAPSDLKQRVAQKTGSMQGRILEEMKAMADPSQEYSATAHAWLAAFKQRV